MKKNILSLLFLPLMLACTQTSGYKVTGSYRNAPEKSKIYLAELTQKSIEYIDSAVIENGTFEFTGSQEAPAIRFLFYSLQSGGEDVVPIVLENGNISVDIDENTMVSGTELNEAFQTYKNEYNDVVLRAENVFKSVKNPENLTPSQRDSLQSVADGVVATLSGVIMKHIKSNIKNPIGAFLISTSGQMCDLEQIFMIADSVPEEYRDERFNNFCKVFKEKLLVKAGAAKTAEGCNFVNFELKDMEGNQILFSNIVEKSRYTLLDFWASWCGPCRKAVPDIKKMYEQYAGKGLAVVSVSLDTDAEAWKKAVSELNMSWLQLCNPDGGSREVGVAYGIEFIPTVIIIDGKGKIVSRGLEGKSLSAKIDELMKK